MELKRIHLITSIVLVIAVGAVVAFVMADFQSSLEEKEEELEQKQSHFEAEQKEKELEQKEKEWKAEQLAKEQTCRELERLLLTVKVEQTSQRLPWKVTLIT